MKIRLTESELNRIITNSVRQVITEWISDDDDYREYDDDDVFKPVHSVDGYGSYARYEDDDYDYWKKVDGTEYARALRPKRSPLRDKNMQDEPREKKTSIYALIRRKYGESASRWSPGSTNINGIYLVYDGDKLNYMTEDADLISPQWFDKGEWWLDSDKFSFGLVEVKLNGKYNFMDLNGKLIHDKWLDWAGCFSKEGIALVHMDGLGDNFMDTDGRCLSKEWFNEFGNRGFIDGVGSVVINGKRHNVYKTKDGIRIEP